MKSLKDKKILISETFHGNKLISEIYYFKRKDVKKAVLEFEKYLKDYIDWLGGNISIKELNKKYFKKYGNPVLSTDVYKKIFGDWEK